MQTDHAFQRWVVLVGASLLFFYSFIQMNMLNPIDSLLMRDFSINAAKLGNLSAMYFYGNFLLLFPAGLLLDRFSPRRIVFLALLFSVLSMFGFAASTSFFTASINRLVMGLCGSFAFLGAIRLVSRWFPPKQMALATGCIVTLAMLGGAVAQTPVQVLTNLFGWRHALMTMGAFGVVLVILFYLVVRDYPADYQHEDKSSANHVASLGLAKSIRLVLFNRYNWLGGLYTTLMNLPIFLLGALWGNMYLTQVVHLTSIQAANVDAAIFFGCLIGSPVVGWISDRLRLRVMPMFVGAIISLVLILMVIYLLNLSYGMIMLLFFLIGFITSTQVLSYPAIAELNSPLLTGSAISVVSLLIMASGFICQPLFGWLMDLRWNHVVVNNIPIYTMENFRFALWMIPIGFILSIVFSLLIKETHCLPQYKK